MVKSIWNDVKIVAWVDLNRGSGAAASGMHGRDRTRGVT